jgi:hypothetical protein
VVIDPVQDAPVDTRGQESPEMNRFNLSGGRAAALMIGSLVIATASMVVSVVVVAGAQTATDSTIPASHQEHEGGMGHGGNHEGGMGYCGIGHGA